MLANPKHWPLAFFILLVVFSYFHIHMRMHTVLLGYKISETQSEIVSLREQHNTLQTQLSQLTLESKLSKAATKQEQPEKKVSKQ